MTRHFLPIALAVMIAAGMAEAQTINLQTNDVITAGEASDSQQIQWRIEYVRGMRSSERAAMLLGICIDNTLDVCEQLNRRIDALTNHAPVVVTNECKYCAWARQQAGPWPTNHLRTPFTLELQDQTGGTHRISFPTNWFSTPIPVLYGRVRVSTNAGGVERGE